MRDHAGRRVSSAAVFVVALGVVAAAIVWVSDVRFKDEASAWDCGVPVGAAWHGREASIVPAPFGTTTPNDGVRSGVFSIPAGTRLTTTVCTGEARTRVAIATAAVLVAVASVVVSRRRRGRPRLA
jgi:hypothetical protein